MTAINWSNVTGLEQIPAQANTATGGYFWAGMLYMVWICLLLLNLGMGLEASLLSASLAALVLGLILVYADLITFSYIAPMIGIIVVYILYIGWNSNRNR